MGSGLSKNQEMQMTTGVLDFQSEYMDIFEIFDTNHDGKINLQSLRKILSVLDTNLDETQIQHIIQDLSTGTEVNFEGFEKAMKKASKSRELDSELKDCLLFLKQDGQILSPYYIEKILRERRDLISDDERDNFMSGLCNFSPHDRLQKSNREINIDEFIRILCTEG